MLIPNAYRDAKTAAHPFLQQALEGLPQPSLLGHHDAKTLETMTARAGFRHHDLAAFFFEDHATILLQQQGDRWVSLPCVFTVPPAYYSHGDLAWNGTWLHGTTRASKKLQETLRDSMQTMAARNWFAPQWQPFCQTYTSDTPRTGIATALAPALACATGTVMIYARTLDRDGSLGPLCAHVEGTTHPAFATLLGQCAATTGLATHIGHCPREAGTTTGALFLTLQTTTPSAHALAHALSMVNPDAPSLPVVLV